MQASIHFEPPWINPTVIEAVVIICTTITFTTYIATAVTTTACGILLPLPLTPLPLQLQLLPLLLYTLLLLMLLYVYLLLFLLRGVQYVLSMMHKCIVAKIGEKQRKLVTQKNVNFAENKGKHINLAEIGGHL